MDKRLALGEAGELRVMSELLLRDFNPARVGVDNGWDMMLEDGRKIQVKAGRKGTGKRKNEYRFTFTSGTYRIENGHRVKKKQDLSKVDFVICWAVEDDYFLIIPTNDMTGISIALCNGFPEKSKSKFVKYCNNWEILRGV